MKYIFFFLVILALLGLPGTSQAAQLNAISAPVLKWQWGGCTSWCQTGWYSSPAVADLDNDGSMEVIAGTYSLYILKGSDGTLKQPAIDPPGDRIWPDIVLADLENDGDMEIVTAHGIGYLNVYNAAGILQWSVQPTPGNELRSLGVYDLDGNGDLEIMVASTRDYDQWWVYEHNGTLRAGDWPQHSPDSDTNGFTAGCFNQNLAAADLTGDGLAEIIGPNDTHYIAAFHADGSQVLANTIYGVNKFWSRVGVHVDHSVDLRGYANCGTEHRPNFANSAPTLSDMDNNGTLEVVVVGNVYNCDTDPYTDLYEIPYIFNADRTRWAAGAYDWTVLPTPDASAAPLSENWEVIESNVPNPVVADLDGDGYKEIIYPSYDGRMHAYWLDKTEHGSFPYSVYSPADGYYTFASEPAIADLDNNGQAEVIFTTWVQKGATRTGKLIILSSQGALLQSVSLPPAKSGSDWNGAMAAPTLANIDADADLEVVINSAYSGVLAYDMPGTASARILWSSGRGNYWRSGSPVISDLSRSTSGVSSPTPTPGATVTFTLTVRKDGILPDYATLNLPFPAHLTYTGGLSASSGTAAYSGGTVTWEGTLLRGNVVTIQFNAQVDAALTDPTAITTIATLQGKTSTRDLRSVLVVNGLKVFLPVVSR
ncbi:MAG TPA: FG-GAP-like repeat-containing protein [Anaerolineaceae bacterium]|nr:FG-GAP-like repeat-containing protein [Anaerolineaceae bacterium]